MKNKVLNYILPLALVLATIGATLVLSQGGIGTPNPGHQANQINGANGLYFWINGIGGGLGDTVPLAPNWEPESSTDEDVVGVDWGTSIIDIVCDPIPGFDGTPLSIWVYGGAQEGTSGQSARLNHRIFAITEGQSYDVYVAGEVSPSGNLNAAQVLRMRANANELEFQRLYDASVGSTISENEATQFECAIKVLSKCYGQSGSPAVCL